MKFTWIPFLDNLYTSFSTINTESLIEYKNLFKFYQEGK